MVVLLIIAQLVVVFVVVVVVKGAVVVVIVIEGISTELFFNEINWLHLNVFMNLSELIIKTLSSSDDFEFEFKLASNAEESGNSLVAIVVIKPNGCCWVVNSLKSIISGESGFNLKSILHNGNSFVDESFK